MIKHLAQSVLFALCIMSQDAMAVPEDDIFQITRASEIEQTETSKKNFVFKDTMTYTFEGALSGNSFLQTLKRVDDPVNSVIKTNEFVAFGTPRQNGAYNPRQVAFYTNDDQTTFLAERCDANKEDGACVLTGSINYNNQRWKIESLNETHYKGTGNDEDSLSISTIKNEANNWMYAETSIPPLEGDGNGNTDDLNSSSKVKRDIHERHRRSVTTTCNIFEIVAVADASVWQYFLERNGDDVTKAENDLRQHYDALFRENETLDWTILTAIGNVDLVPSLAKCAGFNTAGADAPFCFTRKMIQYGPTTVGIRASGRFSSVCSNDTIEAAVLEDNHNGLSRIAALVIAVIIDADILTCTTNPSINNTFRVDDSASTEPSDPTDYSITYTFSNCSIDFLCAKIDLLNNQSNNCLLQGNLTDEQFKSLASHRRLAGEIVALDHQCQLAFGVDSYACELYNFTAGIVIPNTATCGAGAFCTNNGTCGINQTIVYSGTTCGCGKICYKGVCRPDFDCGGFPYTPNGYFTSSGDTSFLATGHLNCCPGTGVGTNVTIKCLRDGWQRPSENCTGPVTTTTTTPTTPTTTPTTSDFGIFPG